MAQKKKTNKEKAINNDAVKADLINRIIAKVKKTAKKEDKAFNGGDLFFTLVFKSIAELKKIAKQINA